MSCTEYSMRFKQPRVVYSKDSARSKPPCFWLLSEKRALLKCSKAVSLISNLPSFDINILLCAELHPSFRQPRCFWRAGPAQACFLSPRWLVQPLPLKKVTGSEMGIGPKLLQSDWNQYLLSTPNSQRSYWQLFFAHGLTCLLGNVKRKPKSWWLTFGKLE